MNAMLDIFSSLTYISCNHMINRVLAAYPSSVRVKAWRSVRPD